MASDPLCKFMGILDIVAGIIIILAFTNTLGIVFGLIMIVKGGMSLV